MKVVKLSVVLLLAVLIGIGLGTTSYAFHDGGVAKCEGCHTMHNSYEGAAMKGSSSQLGATRPYGTGTWKFLLAGADQSSACLNCHNRTTQGSYRVSTDSSVLVAGTAPVNYTPGGDFAWLKTETTGTARNDRNGHNIIADGYGYSQDGKLTKAPGGTYLASNLSCISCHDPHGKYRTDASGIVSAGGAEIIGSGSAGAIPAAGQAVGTYRLLAGINYSPKSVGNNAFTAGPPVAVAPSGYNSKEDVYQVRVAYGKGMSEWCGNCHSGFLENDYASGIAGHTHPAGNNAGLGGDQIAAYNSYVKTGDMSGDAATSFLSLVPFEEQSVDIATLVTHATATATNPNLQGPTSGNTVMCLSCHRAHASGFKSMTRWYNGAEYIAEEGNYMSDYSTWNQTQLTAAYYGRPVTMWADFQRSLCNKCHAKD